MLLCSRLTWCARRRSLCRTRSCIGPTRAARTPSCNIARTARSSLAASPSSFARAIRIACCIIRRCWPRSFAPILAGGWSAAHRNKCCATACFATGGWGLALRCICCFAFFKKKSMVLGSCLIATCFIALASTHAMPTMEHLVFVKVFAAVSHSGDDTPVRKCSKCSKLPNIDVHSPSLTLIDRNGAVKSNVAVEIVQPWLAAQ